MPRGKGARCHGFLSDDGAFAHCTRPEFAGQLEQHRDSETFPHRLRGECGCGLTHGPDDGWGEPEAVYPYRDRASVVRFEVVRFTGKRFRQRRPDGAGGYVWNLRDVERVLYRLDELWAAYDAGENMLVYICEGERDVDAVWKAGGFATTCPGGAGKWRPEYAEQLPRFETAIVVADRDEKGLAHARQVLAALEGHIGSVEVVQAATGKDAADHLAAGHTLDDFEPVCLDEPGPDEELAEAFPIKVYTASDLATLELPTPPDPLVGPFVRRGMETLIGGLTGHGKTTWIAHAVKAAAAGGDFLGETVTGGARVLVLDLEQHLASLQRVICEAGLDDCDTVDYAAIPEGLALDKRGDQLAALEDVLAAKTYELLVVDPFYKLHEADSSDELAARLLVALLRRWINTYGFALLTATHCRKLPAGRNVITLDDLFGSSLFTRDPELVLGIQRWNDLTKLHVFKSREPGLEHGQTFDLLYTRGRGYWPKPTVDPEEREAELERIGEAARDWIAEHPGQSTIKVKEAVGIALKVGRDKVAEALERQVRSGAVPEPLRSGRNAKLWYPLNHAALTCPETLLGQVESTGKNGQAESHLTGADDLSVGQSAPPGQVDEAELDHLDNLREEMGL